VSTYLLPSQQAAIAKNALAAARERRRAVASAPQFEQGEMFSQAEAPRMYKAPSDVFDAANGPVHSRTLDFASPEQRRAFAETQAVVAQRRPAIAAQPSSTPDIIRSGRFLSLHDTGYSNGSPDTLSRLSQENQSFGYPDPYNFEDETDWDQPNAGDHPTYGYMRPGGSSVVAQQEADTMGQYGNVVFNLDPDRVLHSTTVTHGDSLGGPLPETAADVIKGTPRTGLRRGSVPSACHHAPRQGRRHLQRRRGGSW
jgi:hypothetical protein